MSIEEDQQKLDHACQNTRGVLGIGTSGLNWKNKDWRLCLKCLHSSGRGYPDGMA